MPTFNLSVSGVEILDPLPLVIPANGSTVDVHVRLTDPLLWMPRSSSLGLSASYDQANKQLTLQTDLSASPMLLLGGELALRSLTLRLTVRSETGTGDMRIDKSAATPVQTNGLVRWSSPMVAALTNDRSGQLDFDLGYRYNAAGESGFSLRLQHTPVELDRVSVRLEGGELRVDVLPAEPAVLVTLLGDAALIPAQHFATQIEQILRTIFGASAPPLNQSSFRFQRRFSLAADGQPSVPLALPSFTLLPSWSGATPSLDTIDALDISLGLPHFTFSLPDPGQALPDLALSLKQSRIRLPKFAGLESFDLLGNLDFASDATGFRFRFEPTLGGTVALPEIIRFFLAQFRWFSTQLPTLEDLEDLLTLSQSEMEWCRLFKALQVDLDVSQFETAFRALVDGALAAPAGLSLERIFRLAFTALQTEAARLFSIMWKVWFDLAPDEWDRLISLLLASLPDLSMANLNLLLERLWNVSGLDRQALLQAILEEGAARLDGELDAFLRLWLPLLAAAVEVLDPEVLAALLLDALRNASGALAAFRPLDEIPFFQITAPLPSSQFQARADLLLVGLGLQGLLNFSDALDHLLILPATEQFFRHQLGPFFRLWHILFPSPFPIDATRVLGLLVALVNNAEGDEERETFLLQLGRFSIFIALPLVAAAATSRLLHGLFDRSKALPGLGFIFNSIEENNSLKVKRLAPPGSSIKYLIFSDIHRDARSDDQTPFNFGSIDHFSVHKQLYLDLLNHADSAGYTVIEAGDGEELWFIRDFSQHQGAANLLEQIIRDHRPIYNKLADMYKRGKYIRLIGNHDSYLRQPGVFSRLAAAFPDPNPDDDAFDFFDHLIIPGVKTMDDGLFDLIVEMWNAADDQARLTFLRDRLVLDRIGLDSESYQATAPLIVTHGHQWDFWNCDNNNLLGKLIANSVAVPLDMINDPFIDVGGLNSAGSILVDFEKLFANLPILSNFPAARPSAQFAHAIQHMSDKSRMLVDDFLYWETITALVAMFTMPLTITKADGSQQSWSDFLKGSGSPRDLLQHLLNQICIGHTHYPQAHPYFNIEGLVLGPLANVAATLRGALADDLFGFEPSLNFLKARYFNSGTAGWQEGLIWAIEINEHGEARLVYWTPETRLDRPHTMDWQLPRMEDTKRTLLDSKKNEVLTYLAEIPDLFGDSMRELLQRLGVDGVLPLEAVIGSASEMAHHEAAIQVGDVDLLDTADLFTPAAQQMVQEDLTRVSAWLLQFFVRLLHRQLPGTPGGTQTFSLTVSLPQEMAAALDHYLTILPAFHFTGITADQMEERLAEMACVWLFSSYAATNMIRGRSLPPLQSAHPVAWSVLSLVALLPGASEAAPFHSSVSLDLANRRLQLSLTIG